MSANAYQPKVSLLVKLAELVKAVSDHEQWLKGSMQEFVPPLPIDDEVLAWYDRMAKLQHVPARMAHENTDSMYAAGMRATEDRERGVLRVPGVANVINLDKVESLTETRGVPAIHEAVLELHIADGFAPAKVSQVAINDAIAPREGYQIFATHGADVFAEDVASYSEATSVDEALQKCFEQFPIADGYTNHGVKNIETQVVTMAAPDVPRLALSLD